MLNKVNYIDNETVISAKNLNDIQDEIINNRNYAADLHVQNLLDNSDFEHFVAQAGLDGTHCGSYYAGDRWILQAGTISGTANEDGSGYRDISITPTREYADFHQQVRNYSQVKGKTYTAAYADSNGNVYACTFNMGWEGGGKPLGDATFYSIDGLQFLLRIYGNKTVTFKWILCIPGEYTAETLPPYVGKGYGAELVECMRYYYRNWKGELGLGKLYAVFVPRQSRSVSIAYPIPMRIAPTITLYNPVTGNSGVVGKWTDDSDVAAESVYVTNSHFLVSGSIDAGEMYELNYEASADL